MQQLGRGHSVYYADLSRIGEMKRVSAEIAAAEPKIDVLVNNAGALFSSRHVTEDGLELTFALNHLAYFVVTLGLAERLRAAGAARVVNTSSDAHKGKKLDFDDLQSERAYRGFPAYGRSKLCNILFTRELARRWAGTGVAVNCLHPGFVATRFGDQSGGMMPGFIRFAKLFALTPEKGAETLVFLASSDEAAAVTGAYFHKCRQEQPTREAQDDEAARRLWDESARLAGI
jgi:NAD(P)-dependent dehydrogenase (short-subunit alcohol dehydrogenase family)